MHGKREETALKEEREAEIQGVSICVRALPFSHVTLDLRKISCEAPVRFLGSTFYHPLTVFRLPVCNTLRSKEMLKVAFLECNYYC
jgi:hypothetical protein